MDELFQLLDQSQEGSLRRQRRLAGVVVGTASLAGLTLSITWRWHVASREELLSGSLGALESREP